MSCEVFHYRGVRVVSLILLKEYLQKQKLVSMADLRHKFSVSPDLLRDMLARWQQKGQVRCVQKTPACGTKCMRCDPLMTELYQWVDVAE